MTAVGRERLPRPDAAARRQLAELLAGARDLDGDYDSSIELARHLRDRRAAAGQPVDADAVLPKPISNRSNPLVAGQSTARVGYRASRPLRSAVCLPRLHWRQ